MKQDADKNSLLKASPDAGAEGNKLPMSFYRQMCPHNLDDHDLEPGSNYPRILPSLPATAHRSRTTVPLYYTLFLQRGKHSDLSHCVMIVALCNYTCSLCNKLEWMVEGQVNPIISIIIDNNNNNNNESNDNSNCFLLLLLRMYYDNNKNLY